MPIFKAITKVWKALVAGSSVVGCQGTPTGMCRGCSSTSGDTNHAAPANGQKEKLEDEDDFYLKCKDCQTQLFDDGL